MQSRQSRLPENLDNTLIFSAKDNARLEKIL
jgi:hypothetical protein